MSAYSEGRPSPQVVSIARSGNPEIDHDPAASAIDPALQNSLEAFITATRKLEHGLQHEKQITRKLKGDLQQIQGKFERLVQDGEVRTREFSTKEERYRSAMGEYKNREKRLLLKVNGLVPEVNRLRGELDQYKKAWSDVQARERDSKEILKESLSKDRRLQELESQYRVIQQKLQAETQRRDQVERHSKSYQAELQNTLVRLHSAEAKFNELSKEYKALNQSRKNVAEEISRLETQMRERFEWQVAREREQIRSEVEKNASIEREQFREGIRQSVQSEVDRGVQRERAELQQAREQLAQVQSDSVRFRAEFQRLQGEVEQARLDGRQARTQYDQARARIEELTTELEQVQAQNGQKQTEIQQSQVALDRAQSDIQELRSKLQKAEAKLGSLASVEDKLQATESRLQSTQEKLESTQARLQSTEEKLLQAGESSEDVTFLKRNSERMMAELSQVKDALRMERARAAELEVEVRKKEVMARIQNTDAGGQKTEFTAQKAEMMAERKRLQDKVSQLESQIGDLRAQLSRAAQPAELQNLEALKRKLSAQEERAQSLEMFITGEKVRFDHQLLILKAEVEQLRKVNALRELLNAKERALTVLRKTLATHAKDKAKVIACSEEINLLEPQRAELIAAVSTWETQTAQKLELIDQSQDGNVILAGPPAL